MRFFFFFGGGCRIGIEDGPQGFDIQLATQQVTVFIYAAVIDKYPWGVQACEICENMALSIMN